jgi:hypothetical protein
MGQVESHIDDLNWCGDDDQDIVKSVTTIYDDQIEKDVITYLFYDTGRPDGKIVVNRFDCSRILTRRRCALYLHHTFPMRDFSKDKVERCYQIFKLLALKSNGFYMMSAEMNEIHYGDCYSMIGVSINLLEQVINLMYHTRILVIHCYDTKDHSETKRGSKTYPKYSLKELLQYDENFKIFLNFWTNIPDHQQVRDILKENFPEEIIDMISTAIQNP